MPASRKQRPPKILVLGCTGFAGVTCLGWTGPDFDKTNIADFDAVFVDDCSLSAVVRHANEATDWWTREQVSQLEDNLETAKVGITKVLQSRGHVYSVIDRGASLSRSRYRTALSSHDWLPLPLSFTREPGDTLTYVGDTDDPLTALFEGYLKQVEKWDCVFSSDYPQDALRSAADPLTSRLGTELSGTWRPPRVEMRPMPIATDRQGNAIAQGVTYALFRPKHLLSRGVQYEDSAAFESGPFVMLVPPTRVTSEEGLRILLRDICGIQMASVPPSWATSIKMPGDHDLGEEISAAVERVGREQDKLRGLEEKQKQKTALKSILWENGPPLQEACRRVFGEMGIGIKPSPVSDEFMIEYEGMSALVEVSGSKKTVALKDVSQLQKDLAEYAAQFGETIKGVFVGNSWKNRPPSDRGPVAGSIFPDNIVTHAVHQRIALLSTTDLFEAYCAFLENRLTGAEFFDCLMRAEGIVAIPGREQ